MSEKKESAAEELFPSVGAAVEETRGDAAGDDGEEGDAPPLTVMRSMCMQCGGEGETRLLFTKVPFFREIIISSFECDDEEGCGETNREVTFGGKLQLRGIRYEVQISSQADLDREVIKSDTAEFTVPSLEFSIPAMSQKGQITTVEGLLSRAARDMATSLALHPPEDAAAAAQVAEVVSKLSACCAGESFPFKIVLSDPSGNSFVQNPNAPQDDPLSTVTRFTRTPQQDSMLGLQPGSGGEAAAAAAAMEAAADAANAAGATTAAATVTSGSSMIHADNADVQTTGLQTMVENAGKTEAMRFPTTCPHCLTPGDTLMCVTDIPHFKEVVIMAFNCEDCGYRSNDVKGGGAIPDKGTQITLRLESMADMARDVMKSDTCHVAIPELDLSLDYGSLGGMFTSMEGLLSKVKSKLMEGNPFMEGDSYVNSHSEEDVETLARFRDFVRRLDAVVSGEMLPCTLVLRDPLGNSFIASRMGQDLSPEEDPQLTLEDFERTDEENELLGLNDMVVDGYDGRRGGYQNPDHEEILPDRLRQPHTKVSDHPTMFTKGVMEGDTTESSGGDGVGGGDGVATAVAAAATAASAATQEAAQEESSEEKAR